jgi:hypothetical protein
MVLAGAGLIGGVAQGAMPPVLRPMGQAVTFRPFEITVTGADVDHTPEGARLTISYRAANRSEQPSPPPLMIVCDPKDQVYPAEHPVEAPIPANSEATFKTTFLLPARVDLAGWTVAVGNANGPRIALRPAGAAP